MNDNKGGNSGFLFGLILGGAIVFLLGTDKGRKILKSITEEGFDEVSDFIERAGEKIEEAEEEIEEEEPRLRRKVVEEKEEIVLETREEKSNGSAAPAKRRFFRRR